MSGERLQRALVQALAMLRQGDEVEALRIVSAALEARERWERSTEQNTTAGRAGTSRERSQ